MSVFNKSLRDYYKQAMFILVLIISIKSIAQSVYPSSNLISPIIQEVSKDSSRVTFQFSGDSDIKKVRLISDIIPYFDNGINLGIENTGWLKRETNGNLWLLTLTLDNRLRIPYRYEITKEIQGRDTTYEILDPLNTMTYMISDNRLKQSVLELKNCFPFSWNRDTVTKWKKISLQSAILSKATDLYIYSPTPDNLQKKVNYPVVIALGSFTYGIEMSSAKIYRHLLDNNEVKPAVLVLADYKSYNRVQDFDSAALFIIRDVLPYLQKEYHISRDSKDVTLTGTSRRGLVSAYIALKNSKFIGNVISLSGGFFWRPTPKDEFEWFSQILSSEPIKKVNYYLSAGNLETIVTSNNAGHYMLLTNRHIRNLLSAKKYNFKYEELPGGHNPLSWSHALYNGLRYILKK